MGGLGLSEGTGLLLLLLPLPAGGGGGGAPSAGITMAASFRRHLPLAQRASLFYNSSHFCGSDAAAAGSNRRPFPKHSFSMLRNGATNKLSLPIAKVVLSSGTSSVFGKNRKSKTGNRKLNITAPSLLAGGAICLASANIAESALATSDDARGGQEGDSFIFTTLACPFCKRAKTILKEQGVPCTEVSVERNAALRDAVVAVTGRRTVPVIYVNGRYVGGADDLEKLVADGEFRKVLEAPPQKLPDEIRKVLHSAPATPPPPPSIPAPPPGEAPRRVRLEQIARMMARPGTGLERRDVTEGWRTLRKVFSGEAAATWLVQNLPEVADMAEAEAVGGELQRAGLVHHATFSAPFAARPALFFRLHQDEPPPPAAAQTLNARTAWLRPARPPAEVAETLRMQVLELYEFAVSPDGRSVNYKSLAGSPEFEKYLEATEELQKVDPISLTRDEKLAFWINIYNALVIHAMVVKGQPATLLDRIFFYARSRYVIGGAAVSLDDIEHGVLRGNRPTTLMALVGARPFGPADPRRFWSLTPNEPRVHFALNCGARSCPAIRVFSAANAQTALEGAAAAFCETEVEVDRAMAAVRMSKILDWYKADFGDTQEERLRWLLPYLDESKRADLIDLLARNEYTGGEGARKTFHHLQTLLNMPGEADWGEALTIPLVPTLAHVLMRWCAIA